MTYIVLIVAALTLLLAWWRWRDFYEPAYMLRREREEPLRKALSALPHGERVLFYRKYYYRQSTAQIARELGMSERAVEGRLYRLKKSLRAKLGGDRHE